MSTETNKALVRRFVDEMLNARRLEVAEEIISADLIDHDSDEPEGHLAGVAGVQAEVGAFLTAFPDLRVTVDDLIAEGDKVVIRARLAGTQNGDFFGIPPTGKQVGVWVWQTYRIAEGKIAEAWLLVDRMSLMQQLGVIPTPEPTPA